MTIKIGKFRKYLLSEILLSFRRLPLWEFPGPEFSAEIIQFPGISSPIPGFWGSHFQRLGGDEVDMLGDAGDAE